MFLIISFFPSPVETKTTFLALFRTGKVSVTLEAKEFILMYQNAKKSFYTSCPIKFWTEKLLKFESIIVMGHDAARLCTEQCRVAPCRAAPIQNKTIITGSRAMKVSK